MSSTKSVTYSLYLNSNVKTQLIEHEYAALRLDNTFRSLNNTLHMFGLGFAGEALINAGKNWIQNAADIEQSLLRIQNASESATQGIKNQLFIEDEVDKFKINLKDATEAWGNFLVKISSAQLASAEIRKLHDEVLLISKVTAAPQGKMDAAIYDTGKMLGEGILEARSLRALERVMPQITQFLALRLGLDKHGLQGVTDEHIDERTARQALNRLMSSGKLTKAAIQSKEPLLGTFEDYANSLKDKLPSTLLTTQSAIEDLGNTWIKFKTDFTLEHKQDIIDLFTELKDATKYISDHREGIVSTVKALSELFLAYQVIKLANAGIGLWNGINGGIGGGGAGSIQAQQTRNLTVATEELLPSLRSEAEIQAELDAQIAQSTAAYENELLAIEQLGAQLEQVSIQMDLYTTAKMANAETTFQEVKSEMSFSEWLLAGNAELSQRTVLVNQAAKQGVLFTESVLEMTAATKNQTNILEMQDAAYKEYIATLEAVKAEQDAIVAGSLAMTEAIGNQATMMSIQNGGAVNASVGGALGSGLGGFLSTAGRIISSVFIVGMADEMWQSWFGGNIGGHQIGVGDKFGTSDWSSSPAALWDSFYGGNKMGGSFSINPITGKMDDKEAESLEKVRQYLIHSGGLDPFFTPDGQIQPYGKDEKIDALNKIVGAAGLFGGTASVGYGSLNLNEEKAARLAKASLTSANHAIEKSSHIRGNSVTTYNITIKEMNGMKDVKFEGTRKGLKDSENDLGSAMVKVMTNAWNDSQLPARNS